MKRRNYPMVAKMRPKLVIQRRSNTVCQAEPAKLGRTISISKFLLPNKENEQSVNTNSKRFSLDSLRKRGQENSQPVQHRTTVALGDKNLNKINDMLEKTRADDVIFDYRAMIEMIISQLRESNNSDQTWGLLENILTAILEQGSKDQEYLNFLNKKISRILSQSQIHGRQPNLKPSRFQNRATVMLHFQKCVSYVYSPYQSARKVMKAEGESAANLELQSQVLSYKSEGKEDIASFINNTFRSNKNVEEELLSYARYLSSHLAASPTPEATITLAESRLDKEMEVLNQQLIHSKLSFQERNMRMRNFILQMRQDYSAILHDLKTIIERKTEQTRSFLGKVMHWQENSLARREYLSSLRKEYSQAMLCISEAVMDMKGVLREQGKSSVALLEDSIAKMNRIYLVGAVFVEPKIL